jgi:general secretion pathway protein K
MAYMALGQTLSNADLLGERMQRLKAIQRSIRYLDSDLMQTSPRPVRGLLGDGYEPAIRTSFGSEYALEVTHGGWTNPAGLPRGTLQRSAYRIEDGELIRYHWRVLDRTINNEPIQTVLLDGVESIVFRYLTSDGEGSEQWPPANVPVALSLAWDNALDMRRTMTLLYRDQAVHVAMGGESWVQSILRDDLSETDTDHLGEIWASELPGLPVQSDVVQGELFGSIEDLQGRFNVNNLIDQNGEVGIAADWLDANQEAGFPDGAEDAIYTGFIPAYRTPNLPITNATEFAALEGVDKASYDILAPHIVALPGRTGINVNTATPAVLQSLDENLSASDVESLISEREDGGFADLQGTFSTLVSPEVLPQLEETTSYFQLRLVVQIATVRIIYFSTLQRGARGDVVPILRSLGTT